MTKILYVGGLPDHVTDDVLENLFSAYGTVESVTVMINKITDLPDGFGFVEMSCESEAEDNGRIDSAGYCGGRSA